MRGRGVRVIAGAVLAVVGLAGCGKADQQSTPGTSTSQSSAASASPADLKTDMSVEEFAAAMARPGVVVLDVRTPQEFAAGHVKNAVNIDVEAPDFAARVGQLNRQRAYAVYCRSGNRSRVAMQIMRQQGMANVGHLSQGFSAWTAAGQPVEV